MDREISTYKLVDILTSGRFENLFDSEELARFQAFLREVALPSRGFILSVPFEDGPIWGFYEFKQVFIGRESNKVETLPPKYIIPNPNEDLPQELKKYPIWDIEKGKMVGDER